MPNLNLLYRKYDMTLLHISPTNFNLPRSVAKPFLDLQQKLITEYEKTFPILEKVDSAIRALQVLRTVIRYTYPQINSIQPKLYFNNHECRFSGDAQIIMQLTPKLANTPLIIAHMDAFTFFPIMHYNTLILGSRIKVLIDKKMHYSRQVQQLDVAIKNILASLEETFLPPVSAEQIICLLLPKFIHRIIEDPQIDYGEKYDLLSNKLNTLFGASVPLLNQFATDYTCDLVNLDFVFD